MNCYGRAWKHTYVDLTASLFRSSCKPFPHTWAGAGIGFSRPCRRSRHVRLSLLAGRGHSTPGLCREGQGPDLALPKHLRTVVMVSAGKSPSPEGMTWPLQARLQTAAFTSCEAGRRRFRSCAEQAKSLLLFVYFLIKVFCAACKGSKETGGFVELGCFSGQIMISVPF